MMRILTIMLLFIGIVAVQAATTTDTYFGWLVATSPSNQADAGKLFRSQTFKKEPLHVSRAFDRSYYSSKVSTDQLWPKLPHNVTDIAQLAKTGNAIDIRFDGGKSSTSAALNTLFSRSSFDQELLPEKYSFIIRYEELEESGAAIQQLHQGFESEGEQASSVHGYFSASGGAKALHAHTDPYDVFILQVVGKKHWTMCVPPSTTATESFTSAEKATQYAKENANGKSCVSYDTGALATLNCTKFVMEAGDALYLPRDIIHFAETSDEASVHVTIGMGRGEGEGECEQESINSFAADVVLKRQRRYCTSTQSTYGTTYCDTSCDDSCDSCSYVYSGCTPTTFCDTNCDSSCDVGCPSYTNNNNNYNYDDDYSGYTGWSAASTTGVIIGALCCVCICIGIPITVFFCGAGAANRGGGQRGGNVAVPAPIPMQSMWTLPTTGATGPYGAPTNPGLPYGSPTNTGPPPAFTNTYPQAPKTDTMTVGGGWDAPPPGYPGM